VTEADAEGNQPGCQQVLDQIDGMLSDSCQGHDSCNDLSIMVAKARQ